MTIDEAKKVLPLPALLHREGLGDHAKKSAKCPFHDDDRNSFSVYKNGSGVFQWKCFAGCGRGDEIDFLEKRRAISRSDATKLFIEMAGGSSGSKLPGTAFKKAKAVMSKDWQPEPKSVTLTKPVPLSQTFDWQKCVEAFTDKHAEALAKWRGYSPEFVHEFREKWLIGIYDGCYAFPVHNASHVVGAHVRSENGDWFYHPKGTKAAPLIFGEIAEGDTVHCFESTWDALAFMDLSDERSGVICTRGASNARFVIEAASKASVLYLWTQNDAAGEKWQKDICANTKATVKRVKIPAHDLNDWTRAGATVDELVAAMTAAETLREQEKSWDEALIESIVTSRELGKLALAPRKKLLGEWFAEADSGFIYAPRGAGKTWFALAIAQALSTAGKIGDWGSREAVKVLYIDTEMPPDLMKERINGMGTNERLTILSHDILFERCEKVLNVATPEVQAAITKRCVDAGVKVLFIDNLSTGARGMRENESDDWEKLIPWLLDLRRRKIAVVIIHHAGRSGNMRGTSRREDAVSWIICLDDLRKDGEDKRGARFVSRFVKCSRNTQEIMPALEWHFMTETDGQISISHKVAATIGVFVEHIRDGVSKPCDLAEAMNLPGYAISKLAKKAIDQGLITKTGHEYQAVEEPE